MIRCLIFIARASASTSRLTAPAAVGSGPCPRGTQPGKLAHRTTVDPEATGCDYARTRRPAARRRGRARANHWWASARTPTSASRLGRNGLLRPTYLPGRGPRWRAGRLRSPAAPCCCSSSRPLVQVRRVAAPVAPVPPRVNRTASWSAMHTSPSPKTSSTPPAYRVPRRLPTRSNRALEPNEHRLQATTTPSIRMSRVGAAGRVDVAPIDGFDMAARADQRDAERSPRVVPSKTRGTPGAPARGSPDIRRSGRSFHGRFSGGYSVTRVQLKLPNVPPVAVSVVSLCADGDIVRFRYSSGNVEPCTTMRWKFGTL
jgi:hypothetical protein